MATFDPITVRGVAYQPTVLQFTSDGESIRAQVCGTRVDIDGETCSAKAAHVDQAALADAVETTLPVTMTTPAAVLAWLNGLAAAIVHQRFPEA